MRHLILPRGVLSGVGGTTSSGGGLFIFVRGGAFLFALARVLWVGRWFALRLSCGLLAEGAERVLVLLISLFLLLCYLRYVGQDLALFLLLGSLLESLLILDDLYIRQQVPRPVVALLLFKKTIELKCLILFHRLVLLRLHISPLHAQ